MGSGKSSIGRRLAARLGYPFIDSDAEIEAAAGCSINEIFERYGEAAFRQGERRVMTRLLAGGPIVLGTGGGAFMDAETRAAIRRSAISVWLRADLKTLVARCARRMTRPLLNVADPAAVLAKLMAERYPVYAAADIIVDSSDGPHEDVVDAILKRLATFTRDPAPAHPSVDGPEVPAPVVHGKEHSPR
jgi:shikimate kinase